ncbi:MAG: DNA methyltransferase [Candidatus Dormibacteria bacterium]
MTELIWDGKYDARGKKQGPVRIALPFQTIETVNESAQDRRRNLELFASGRDTEWRNRLIWGDKKYVLPSLLPEFAGKVNLIYIDPPFDTGTDFSFTASISDDPDTPEDEAVTFTKEASIIEQKAYRDTWGRGQDSYLQWLFETTIFLRELLASDGNLFLHLGVNMAAYARPLLTEILGPDAYTNEIVWKRSAAHSDIGQGAPHLGRLHDVIYWYRAGEASTVNMQYEPYSEDYVRSAYKHVEPATGRRYRIDNTSGPGGARKGNPYYEFRGVKKYWRYSSETIEKLYVDGRLLQTKSGGDWGYKRYLDEMPGVPIQDLWLDIPPLQSQSAERTGYDTQKPEKLLERIISLGSNEGDLILDCFAGSGTTAVVAEKLGRRWIGCDLGRFAIHTTRKRLLGIPGVKPFIVQNLGKYERQAWQVAEFPANGKDHLEEQREREAAYRKFILDLYHATPMTGYTWLHGTKSGRMVHVAAVDAPVTQADVKSIAREAWKAVGSGKDAPTKASVDILGWEFALEVNELAKNVAAESRVDVSFKKIPREVLDKKAIEQGDVRFFELGALSVDAKQKAREVTLKLTDFVVPTDDIPEEARKAIKHWSQLVDYWAVDWDYKNDTFHNQWQAYRTRKEPKIELETKYTYSAPGKYTVVVKVIDILGNDTTKTLEITVK